MLITLTNICVELLRLKLIVEWALLGAIIASLVLLAIVVWKSACRENLSAKMKQFQVGHYLKPAPAHGRYAFPWKV